MNISVVRDLVGLSAILLCSPLAALTFEDISGEAGFTPGHTDQLPAGGIAVADFDGNGYPDIFVTGGTGHENRLYFNDGDGSFSDDAEINADLVGENCSVAAAADFDNDGWPDLYVGCRWADNHLFRNLQGEGFEDVTPEALDHDPPCCTSTRTDGLAWADLTGNGHLDLYIAVFTGAAPSDDPDTFDRIMLNNGDGSWTNAAEQLDDDALRKPALAVAISDLNGSGRPDIYVVNDKRAGNHLWRNDGAGCGSWCFTDVSESSGTDIKAYGMGIAIGDVNRDGLWDLFFSSIDEQHLMLGVSADPLEFEEVVDTPLNHDSVGWGTIFADFDNDGWEDAYLAVGPESFAPTELVDQVYRNQGDGSFSNVTAGSGLGTDIATQAAAYADFDRDGKLDLVLHHWNQDPGYRIYRNVTADTGNWIAFELTGGGPVNRDAIGARIRVTTPDGEQIRELRAGESRGASHDRILHFGLGEHSAAGVTIFWPDGTEQSLGSLSGCRYHRLAHPQATPPEGKNVIFTNRFESSCN